MATHTHTHTHSNNKNKLFFLRNGEQKNMPVVEGQKVPCDCQLCEQKLV